MSTISSTDRAKQGTSPGRMTGSALVRGDVPAKTRTSTTLSVIVPAYNEQFLIEASLARLEVLGESSLLEQIKVIVVDDGSSDGTADAIARFRESHDSPGKSKLSWLWLRHEKNSGKGSA